MGLHQTPNLPAPWPWTSHFPEQWEIDVCCLSATQFMVFCYSGPNTQREPISRACVLPASVQGFTWLTSWLDPRYIKAHLTYHRLSALKRGSCRRWDTLVSWGWGAIVLQRYLGLNMMLAFFSCHLLSLYIRAQLDERLLPLLPRAGQQGYFWKDTYITTPVPFCYNPLVGGPQSTGPQALF